MITTRRRRHLVGLLAVAFVIVGCSRGGDDADSTTTLADRQPVDTQPDDPIVTVNGESVTTSDAAPDLELALSDGDADDSSTDDVELVSGTPLDDDEVAAVLDRLPAWDDADAGDDGNDDEPAEPPATVPPPEVDEPVDQPFPPGGDEPPPDEAPAGPLDVLRFQPEGEVDLAPFVTATFSEPMVPVATLDELDAADVPMTITPEVEGSWRWIGTRTLRFEVVPGELDRLPDATSYEVAIPGGTRSANGAVLGQSVRWTFQTPTPGLVDLAGVNDSMPTDPVWVATFDQRVDPAAVLDTIAVTADGTRVATRLARPSELERDADAARAYDDALDDRAVAFVPVGELPVDTTIQVAIGPDVPSAEGPLTSPTVERFSGRTFGALEVRRSTCGFGNGCVPGAPFVFEFSNRLDPDAFSADLIEVSPSIPGLHIDVLDNTIEMWGATDGQTTYTVTLDGALADVFGQQLGDDVAADFDVGSARPALRGLSREFITTDPNAEHPSVSISTINHDAVRVRAWAVTPAELPEFYEYLDELGRDEDAPVPEWTEVADEQVEIANEPDSWVESTIDLDEAMNAAGGEIVVRVDSLLDISDNDDDYWANRPTVAWVQHTTLGVDAIFDHDKLVIATTDLVTGAPVDGVPVELLGDGRVATTDEEGLVEVPLDDAEVTGLFANAGDRTALLPADRWGGWQLRDTPESSRWFVFDDRGVYQPGETVHVSGWTRRFEWDEGTRLDLLGDDVTVSYVAYGPQGAELADGTVELTPAGGFTLDIEIPDGADLGQARIDFSIDDPEESDPRVDYLHGFQVQEFRRPEFEVDTRAATPPPHYDDEPVTVAVDATYFTGAPVADADVTWLVATSDTSYSPPNWDDFTFGVWQPWWFGAEAAGDVAMGDACIDCGPFPDDTEYEEFTGRTNADGSHTLRIDVDGAEVDLPSTVTTEATVTDVNRQAWSARTDLLVHPADYYVGLRTDRYFVEPGTPIRVDAVVTDVDGEIAAGHDVEFVAGRLEWNYTDGAWTDEVVDTQTCALTSTDAADDESMRCEFDTEVGGTYRITATVTDESGQSSRTEITQWVSGGASRPTRGVEHEQVTIVPDRESYAPGDVAELLVQAPFAPAHGIVTFSHRGIVRAEAFEAEDGSAVIEVPIEDAHVPNLTVQVDMNGSTARTDAAGNLRDDLPPRTAYATGEINLSIPPVTRALDVDVEPADDALEPGDDTSVTATVTDHAGAPVEGAEVAVVVVDEAVLSLTGYELADPLDVFYADLASLVESVYSRATVFLSSADDLGGDDAGAPSDVGDGEVAEEAADEAAEGADADRSSDEAIAIRTDFDPVAVYAPQESTGADGTVTVDVPLPDNLTSYRVMAVAVHGAEQFGKGEASITARLPLMVQASAPRFLNYGDRFELPVVLHNRTDEPLDVDVATQVDNLDLADGAGQHVTVPAQGRVEVRFPADTVDAGTARVRVAAVSGSFTDAAEFTMPVHTPTTREAFATYGVIDEVPVAQPLVAPEGVIADVGGLEVGASSTALQSLTDAVLYLVDYPYTSSDGYATRIIGVATLRDVLDAFDAQGLPNPDQLDDQVAADIRRLDALQNDDGGFPYWQRGRQSIPWNSIQAAHALVLAREAGYTVPEARLEAAFGYIADIESHFQADYSDDVKAALSAYALYVRDLAGRTDTAKAEALFERRGDELELDALAWLWPSIRDPEMRAWLAGHITNSAVDTAGAVTFATDYDEDAYVIAQSDVRTDAVVLDAIITQMPDSDLIPKVVAGLDARRQNGRWRNDQENSLVLVAMKRYFDAFEATDPAFVGRAWIGDTFVAESPLLDRATTRSNTLVPMNDLIGLTTPADDAADPADPTLVLAKNGTGRMYYRLGLSYAPADLELDARDEGFVVERTYEPVGDTADVSRGDDGTWQIAAGATVRVRVTMVADARRTNVALIDHLPGGLEPINPDLAVSQTVPPDDGGDAGDEGGDDVVDDIAPSLWWWRWFEHQNLRDDRAEAFASYLGGGTYEYTYLARATTPGTFVTPPTTAEEIYAPEVFGRSATDVVVVE